MEMRRLLLSIYRELDNGVTWAVPLDLLEKWAIRSSISMRDFAHAMHAALHEGDLEVTSPGMISMTETGTRRFAENFL